MRAFINRDDVDFGLAGELAPTQEWTLTEDSTASLEYATRFAKFQSVSSLTLHFPRNGGAPHTRIYFVGLRGEVRCFAARLPQCTKLADLEAHFASVHREAARRESRRDTSCTRRGRSRRTTPCQARRGSSACCNDTRRFLQPRACRSSTTTHTRIQLLFLSALCCCQRHLLRLERAAARSLHREHEKEVHRRARGCDPQEGLNLRGARSAVSGCCCAAPHGCM
jgi:hypothetical protein